MARQFGIFAILLLIAVAFFAPALPTGENAVPMVASPVDADEQIGGDSPDMVAQPDMVSQPIVYGDPEDLEPIISGGSKPVIRDLWSEKASAPNASDRDEY